jgi:hypothetical protein
VNWDDKPVTLTVDEEAHTLATMALREVAWRRREYSPGPNAYDLALIQFDNAWRESIGAKPTRRVVQ